MKKRILFCSILICLISFATVNSKVSASEVDNTKDINNSTDSQLQLDKKGEPSVFVDENTKEGIIKCCKDNNYNLISSHEDKHVDFDHIIHLLKMLMQMS